MASSHTKTSIVHLDEASAGQVVLTTQDSDRFIKTQREVVAAMRGAENMLTLGEKLSNDLNAMVRDVQAWCKTQQAVAQCLMYPRADDLLAVVISRDEDPDGVLDEAVSKIDLEMFSRNTFRVTWLMLRSTEASGLSSFVDLSQSKVIYRADGH
jgi:hypothetical protein